MSESTRLLRKRRYSNTSELSSGKLTPREDLQNSMDALITQCYKYKNVKLTNDNESTSDSLILCVNALIDLSEFNKSDIESSDESNSSEKSKEKKLYKVFTEKLEAYKEYKSTILSESDSESYVESSDAECDSSEKLNKLDTLDTCEFYKK